MDYEWKLNVNPLDYTSADTAEVLDLGVKIWYYNYGDYDGYVSVVGDGVSTLATLDKLYPRNDEIDANTSGLVDAVADIATNTSGLADAVADIATNTSAVDGVGSSVTGTATFTNSTNNVELTGVGSLEGLEKGDVVQFSDSVSNSSEYTVSTITDSDNVIFNADHAGGTTTKAFTDETATAGVTAKLLCKWYNAPKGLGQGWANVTTSRALVTSYTNTKNRAVETRINIKTTTAELIMYLTVGGELETVTFSRSAGSFGARTITVPSGDSISVYGSSTASLVLWGELC